MEDVSYVTTKKPYYGGDKEANVYYTIQGAKGGLYLDEIVFMTGIDVQEIIPIVTKLVATGYLNPVSDFNGPFQTRGIEAVMQSNMTLPKGNVMSLSSHDFVPHTRQILG